MFESEQLQCIIMKDEGMVPISLINLFIYLLTFLWASRTRICLFEILTRKAIPSHIPLLSFRIRQLLSYGNKKLSNTLPKVKSRLIQIELHLRPVIRKTSQGLYFILVSYKNLNSLGRWVGKVGNCPVSNHED